MMPHTDDFADAHRRHWEDAELLFKYERWANADHLYGLSAECGLKAIMLRLGMGVDADGTRLKPQNRKHMPKLWSIFEDFARDRDRGRYLAPLSDAKSFGDWSIHDRYANRHRFMEEGAAPHREAACRIGDVVRQVEQERTT